MDQIGRGKSARPLWNPTHPPPIYNTQIHKYRYTKTQIQIHKYTSDRARKKYTAIMEARLNSSTPSFPLLHCTKLGGKVTFMLQIKLSQNRCNAILSINLNKSKIHCWALTLGHRHKPQQLEIHAFGTPYVSPGPVENKINPDLH